MGAPPAPQARGTVRGGTGVAVVFGTERANRGPPWRFTLTAPVTLTIVHGSYEPRCGRSPGGPGTPRIGRSGRSHHGQPVGWPPYVLSDLSRRSETSARRPFTLCDARSVISVAASRQMVYVPVPGRSGSGSVLTRTRSGVKSRSPRQAAVLSTARQRGQQQRGQPGRRQSVHLAHQNNRGPGVPGREQDLHEIVTSG